MCSPFLRIYLSYYSRFRNQWLLKIIKTSKQTLANLNLYFKKLINLSTVYKALIKNSWLSNQNSKGKGFLTKIELLVDVLPGVVSHSCIKCEETYEVYPLCKYYWNTLVLEICFSFCPVLYFKERHILIHCLTCRDYYQCRDCNFLINTFTLIKWPNLILPIRKPAKFRVSSCILAKKYLIQN